MAKSIANGSHRSKLNCIRRACWTRFFADLEFELKTTLRPAVDEDGGAEFTYQLPLSDNIATVPSDSANEPR